MRDSHYPPFAKCAKSGAPPASMVTARSKSGPPANLFPADARVGQPPAQVEFQNHFQRGAARGAVNTPHWDIIGNPLVGAADKRQKAWKAMLKKHQALIDYYKNPVRQEVLELEEGEQV